MKHKARNAAAARILVVDDDERSRLLLINHIRHMDTGRSWEVIEAADGFTALDAVRSQLPDLILLDLLMPGMDGIETLREIRKLAGPEALPVIFISAVADRRRWAAAFEAGANDFLNKSVDKRELRARIAAHLKLGELGRQNRALQKELKVAGDVQKKLLPSNLHFPGIKMSAFYHAFTDVGGDLYDAWQSNDTVHAVLGDISGHDASAALIMAVCKGLIQAHAHSGHPPYKTVEDLNRKLYDIFQEGGLDMFMTMTYATFEPSRDRLRLISCGHPPCFLLSGMALHQLETTGPALGFREGITWKTHIWPFRHGDTLLMYTDGLIELRNPKDETFPGETLHSLMRKRLPPDRLLHELVAEAMRFSGGSLGDDIAALAIRRE